MSFEELQQDFLKAERTVKEAQEHLAKLRAQRNELCPHTETKPGSYYFSGSYYDRAYTDSWDECTCCGKKMNEKHETHSWFG